MKERFYKWLDKLLVKMLTILGFSSTFAFMACYAPPPEDLDYINLSNSYLHFMAEGGSQTVEVRTEDEWVVNGGGDFFNVYPKAGKGNSLFTVDVMENTMTGSRARELLVQGVEGKASVSLFIYQDGGSYAFSVSPDSIIFSYKEIQMETIVIQTNDTWKVTAVPSFVDVYPIFGYGKSQISVMTKAENIDSVDFVGHIVIEGLSGRNAKVHLTQKHK